MNLAIFLFVLTFCGLTLAQKSNDAIVVEKITETQSCNPDMCEILKELVAMTNNMRVIEIRLKVSETRLTESETRLKESETRLKESETQIHELKNKDFAAMTEKLGAVETRLTESETQIVELKIKERTTVVFSAAIGGKERNIGPFDRYTTLVFRRVITNIDDAYDPLTGIFTAPIAGVYYFTFSYHAGNAYPVNLQLFKNNELLAMSHDHKTVHDSSDNGGNAVFVQLQQGDQVCVSLSANTHVWGNDASTTFSGFLVNQV